MGLPVFLSQSICSSGAGDSPTCIILKEDYPNAVRVAGFLSADVDEKPLASVCFEHDPLAKAITKELGLAMENCSALTD